MIAACTRWRGLWCDGGAQEFITPMEPHMDLTVANPQTRTKKRLLVNLRSLRHALLDSQVRTFLDPLNRHVDESLHPRSRVSIRTAICPAPLSTLLSGCPARLGTPQTSHSPVRPGSL